ncbi:hypothetical protein FF38_05460 [Lucilia cuprina]|uniref:Uncharacterized protein n=1 Tax=Lucilia cuprina TaxID=7375 RepID=A0A0L0C313_LUCCU|nr:hypothetical protein FF38_05460 [Lucilia cuprina]
MFVNLFMLVLSINYEIQTINSASLSVTTEAVNPIVIPNSSTTEALDISRDAGKLNTDKPDYTEIPELPPTISTLSDFDRQLKDIFVITGPTSTTSPSDEFSPEELEISDENGETLSLGRRTNFKTRHNCRCIIRNRCARTNSCLKEAKEK